MPEVKAPIPQPIKTDIQLFARSYFNIELTSVQMELIAIIASGSQPIIKRRQIGLSTVNKVVLAYLQAGIRTNGRDRLPMHPLPPRAPMLKGSSQVARILNTIKQPTGAYNWQLSRIALKYTSVISELRKDGHDIQALRQYNKNGKATATWLYICND